MRKRNYPQERWSDYLYVPEGGVTLDEQELLDEWGREFLGEGRRRVDLIRSPVASTLGVAEKRSGRY